jgi:flagellar protein FliS
MEPMVIARGNGSPYASDRRGPRDNPNLRDSVETASPGRLLVMLYDRLALDLERAEAACANGDVQVAHDALLHAQEILAELHASLDHDAWAPAAGLAHVYEFMIGELCTANIHKDSSRVINVRRVLAPLHSAWRDAAGVVDPPVVQKIGA